MEQRDDRPTRGAVVEPKQTINMSLKIFYYHQWGWSSHECEHFVFLRRFVHRSALAVSHETSYISALMISFRWDSRARFCLLRCELLSWSDQFRSHRLSSNPTEIWKLYFCLQFSLVRSALVDERNLHRIIYDVLMFVHTTSVCLRVEGECEVSKRVSL